jgi:hypothetical protein
MSHLDCDSSLPSTWARTTGRSSDQASRVWRAMTAVSLGFGRHQTGSEERPTMPQTGCAAATGSAALWAATHQPDLPRGGRLRINRICRVEGGYARPDLPQLAPSCVGHELATPCRRSPNEAHREPAPVIRQRQPAASVTSCFTGSSAPSARGRAAGGAGAPSSRPPAMQRGARITKTRTPTATQLATRSGSTAPLTTEPSTRSLTICTPAPGVKGAMRRYAMAYGHP